MDGGGLSERVADSPARLSNGLQSLGAAAAPAPKPKPPVRAKPAMANSSESSSKPVVRRKPAAGAEKEQQTQQRQEDEQKRKSATLPADQTLKAELDSELLLARQQHGDDMPALRPRAHTADNPSTPPRPRRQLASATGVERQQRSSLDDQLSALESESKWASGSQDETSTAAAASVLSVDGARARSNSKLSFRSRSESTAKLADQAAMEEMRTWFSQLGLPQYADSFIVNGYDDLSMLGMLDDADLQLCGVHDVAHRKLILHAAAETSCTDPDQAEDEWERPSSPQEVEVRIRDRMVTSEDVDARARESLARNSLSQIVEQLCTLGGITPMTIPSPLATESTLGTKENAIMPPTPLASHQAPELTGDADIDLDDLLYDLVKFNPQHAIDTAAVPTPPESPQPPTKDASNKPRGSLPTSSASTSRLPDSSSSSSLSSSASSTLASSSASSSAVGNNPTTSSGATATGLERKTSLPVMLSQAHNDDDKQMIASMWQTLESASQVQDVKQPSTVHTPAEAQRATLEVEQKIKKLKEQLEGEGIWTEEEIGQKVKAEKLRIAMLHIKEARVAQGRIHAYDEDGTERSLVANEKTDAWTAAHQLAIKAEVDLQKPWTLIERDEEFNLERTLEDHEQVYLISSRWPRTGKRRFIFKIDFKKNDLFENPEAYFPAHIKVAGMYLQRPQERVEKARKTFLKDYFTGIVRIPELETQCYLREKLKSWKKYNCVVRSSGLYYSKSRGKTSDSKNLLCYTKFSATDIFSANNYKKMFKAPSEHVLALRPETGACANGMLKCIAFESRTDLLSWKAAMRCAKYGLKLREDYELYQRRQMVINRMFSSPSSSNSELRSPPLSRGGTIRLIPIKRSDNDVDARQQNIAADAHEQTSNPGSAQSTSTAASIGQDEFVYPTPKQSADSMLHESSPGTTTGNEGGASEIDGGGGAEELPPTQPKLISASLPPAPASLTMTSSTRSVTSSLSQFPDDSTAEYWEDATPYDSRPAMPVPGLSATAQPPPPPPAADIRGPTKSASSSSLDTSQAAPLAERHGGGGVQFSNVSSTLPPPPPPMTTSDIQSSHFSYAASSNGTMNRDSPDLPPPPPVEALSEAAAVAAPPPSAAKPPPIVPKKRPDAAPKPSPTSNAALRTPPPPRKQASPSPHAAQRAPAALPSMGTAAPAPVAAAQHADNGMTAAAMLSADGGGGAVGGGGGVSTMSIKQRSHALVGVIGRRPPMPTPTSQNSTQQTHQQDTSPMHQLPRQQPSPPQALRQAAPAAQHQQQHASQAAYAQETAASPLPPSQLRAGNNDAGSSSTPLPQPPPSSIPSHHHRPPAIHPTQQQQQQPPPPLLASRGSPSLPATGAGMSHSMSQSHSAHDHIGSNATGTAAAVMTTERRSPQLAPAAASAAASPPIVPRKQGTVLSSSGGAAPAPAATSGGGIALSHPPPPVVAAPNVPMPSAAAASAARHHGDVRSSGGMPPPGQPPPPVSLSSFGPSALPQPFAQHTFAQAQPMPVGAHGYDQPTARQENSTAVAHASEPWFHGPVTRAEAESLLRGAGGQNGLYLIRESSMVPGSYVMTMMGHGRIHNFHIECFSDGHSMAYGIDNSPRFPALSMLIDHFRQNSHRLPCPLSYYVSRA
ncbi:ras-associated and pleckstrin homology domains-containing protein 1-like [Sycon ciliatum]|uniref:ras-associated and pleckstrin homology domains-containing protein 1-like n=1 Tax=Sycon ciliatum TaxID=27933 RepID=UPI0031F64DFD